MHKSGWIHRRLTQGISISLCAALILLSPGLAPYQAWAAGQQDAASQTPADPTSAGPLAIDGQSLAPIDAPTNVSEAAGPQVDAAAVDLAPAGANPAVESAIQGGAAAGVSVQAAVDQKTVQAVPGVAAGRTLATTSQSSSLFSRIKASFQSLLQPKFNLGSTDSAVSAALEAGKTYDQSAASGHAANLSSVSSDNAAFSSSGVKKAKKSALGVGLVVALPAIALAKSVRAPAKAAALAGHPAAQNFFQTIAASVKPLAGLIYHPAAAPVKHALSVVGKVVPLLDSVGNILGALMVLPEIYGALTDENPALTAEGDSKFASQLKTGAALTLASYAFGVIVGPVLHQRAAWTLQNNYGGSIMAASLLIRAVRRSFGWGAIQSPALAVLATLGIGALMILPGFLISAYGWYYVPLAIAKNSIGFFVAEWVGAIIFVGLFVPSVLKARKNQTAPEGLTPGLALLYSVGSAMLGVVALTKGEWVNFAQNIIGVVFGGEAFRLSRKYKNNGAQKPAKEPPKVSMAPQTPEVPQETSPPKEGLTSAQSSSAAPSPPQQFTSSTNFFGLVSLQGKKSGPPLAANATIDQIIDRLAIDTNNTRERVIQLANDAGLVKYSRDQRQAWMGLYDGVQAIAEKNFAKANGAKYHGWFTARLKFLAQTRHESGLAFVWETAKFLAVQMPVFLFFRMPIETLDYILGYFHHAISYHWFHENENWLGVQDAAQGEAILLEVLGKTENDNSIAALLRSNALGRFVYINGVKTFGSPFVQFMMRRLFMGVLSMIVTGIVAALAPHFVIVVGAHHIALFAVHLTDVPYLGQGLVWLAYALPYAAAHIPFVGGLVSHALAEVTTNFINDLVVGPILNSTLLSVFMVMSSQYPSLKDAFKDMLEHPFRFAWKVFKTWFGMATLGAEIAGFMNYLAGLDGVVSQAVSYLLHRSVHVTLLQRMGAAIEKKEGIPVVGGAIDWGNKLLLRGQDVAVHGINYVFGTHITFNLSDAVMHATDQVIHRFYPNTPLLPGRITAEQVFGAYSRDPHFVPYKVDDQFLGLTSKKALHSMNETAASAGQWSAEVAAAKRHVAMTQRALGQTDRRLAALKKESYPVTRQERARLDALSRTLDAKRNRLYVESKLGEQYDVTHPVQDAAPKMKDILALLNRYDRILPPPSKSRPGMLDSLAVHSAALAATSREIGRMQDHKAQDRLHTAKAVPEKVKAISELVTKIETDRTGVQKFVTASDAVRQGLEAADVVRQTAAKVRNNGQAMQGLHEDMAKNKAVSDFKFSKAIIGAVTAQLNNVMGALRAQDQSIQNSQNQNTASLNLANSNLGQIPQWNTQAATQVGSDQAGQQNVQNLQGEVAYAQSTLSNFQTKMSGLVAALTANNALQTDQKNLDYINSGQAAQAMTTGSGTSPSGAAYSSGVNINTLNKFLTQITASVNTIKDPKKGLPLLQSGDPVQIVGGAILNVPTDLNNNTPPSLDLNDPNQKQPAIDYINKRQAGYDAQAGEVMQVREIVKGMLGQGPHANDSSGDVFGNQTPLNLYTYLSQEQSDLSTYGGKTQGDLAALDQLTATVNDAFKNTPGFTPLNANLHTEGWQQLKTDLPAFGAALQAVKTGSLDLSNPMQAKAEANLAAMAYLALDAGYNLIPWAKAGTAIPQINSGIQMLQVSVLPALNGLNDMFAEIKTDSKADIDFLDAGGGLQYPAGDPRQTAADQRVIDRKIKLVGEIALPRLTRAQTMLQQLIPFEQSQIDSVKPNGVYSTLYTNQINLIQQAQNAYNTIVPWALASHGAAQGDVQGSLTSIQNWQNLLTKNIWGYDDPKNPTTITVNVNGQNQTVAITHHTGIAEAAAELEARLGQDLNGNPLDFNGQPITVTVPGTNLSYTYNTVPGEDAQHPGQENLYGRQQDYSLPKKIKTFSGDMTTQAGIIKADATKLNILLQQIQSYCGSGCNLAPYMLQTNIGTDPSSVNIVQNMATGTGPQNIQNLVNYLTQIGNAAKAAAGPPNLPSINGKGGVPTGNQPSVTVNKNQQIALWAVEAGALLAPSSQTPHGQDLTSAVAEYLYANGVVTGAKNGIAFAQSALPIIKAGLQTMGGAYNVTTTVDIPYVTGTGRLTPDQVYTAEINNYQNLNDFLTKLNSFFGQEVSYDQGAFATINQVQQYWNGVATIAQGGVTVNGVETQANQAIEQSIQGVLDELQATGTEVNTWLAQLNDPHQSSLSRISARLDTLMEQDRDFQKAQHDWAKRRDEFKAGQSQLKDGIDKVSAEQTQLYAQLKADPSLLAGLSDDLQARIEALHLSEGTWGMDGGVVRDPVLVLPKSGGPLAKVLTPFLKNVLPPETSPENIAQIEQSILADPRHGLPSIMPPGSRMFDVGDSLDGFYLVYRSQLGVPGSLTTENWITFGNVLRWRNSGVDISAYQMDSSPTPSNAPWGDKGVEATINVIGDDSSGRVSLDVHRYALDIPLSQAPAAQAHWDRLMITPEYTALLDKNGDVYFGFAGVGDISMGDVANNPAYYGGNAKIDYSLAGTDTQYKIIKAAHLNAEQQYMAAHDPRWFSQNINVNWGGWNQNLAGDYIATAHADDSHFSSTKAGITIDGNQLLKDIQSNNKDALTIDLYANHSGGTDDITQNAGGISLRTVTVRGSADNPITISNRVSGEAGQKYNSGMDQLSVTFPRGIQLGGQGQFMGREHAYLGQLRKEISSASDIGVSVGSPFIGEPNRLTFSFDTHITIEQMIKDVTGEAKKNFVGGEVLADYNRRMEDFVKADKSDPARLAELKRALEEDVAMKLLQQKIGNAYSNISQLQKAGAFAPNTSLQGLAGFTSNAISKLPNGDYDTGARAFGGGPVAGVYTKTELTKTQRKLIESKAADLYLDGLALQERIVALKQDLDRNIIEMAAAQWDLKNARLLVRNAPTDLARAQAEVLAAKARERYDQALVQYSASTGRSGADAALFANLSAADIQSLMREITADLSTPEGLDRMIHSLDQSRLEAGIGKTTFRFLGREYSKNMADWLPFLSKFSFGYGVAMGEALGSQAEGAGLSAEIPLPFLDPTSKRADHMYVLQSDAAKSRMAQIHRDHALKLRQERLEAASWREIARALGANDQKLNSALLRQMTAYHNGLAGPSEVEGAFEPWYWYRTNRLKADAQAALAESWAAAEKNLASPEPQDRSPFAFDLKSAVKAAEDRSPAIEELSLRVQAAQEKEQIDAHRLQQIFVDAGLGFDVTATGEGFFPKVAPTLWGVTLIPGFRFGTSRLKNSSVANDKAQAAYNQNLQKYLRAQLAVELFDNASLFKSSQARLQLFDRSLIPQRQSELDAARRASGGRETAQVARASRLLDQARMERIEAETAGRQALASINNFLGRAADAPLTIDASPEALKADLSGILKDADPVGVQHDLLASRVAAARSWEEIVDRGDQVQTLMLDPMSLFLRASGRVFHALGAATLGNEELKAGALIDAVQEENALDHFLDNLRVEQAKADVRLNAIQSRLAELSGKNDPQSLVEIEDLKGQERVAEASRAALRLEGQAEALERRPMPLSFGQLRERLRQGSLAAQSKLSQKELQSGQPGNSKLEAQISVQLAHVRRSLGGDDIDKNYINGWVEYRLSSLETPPQTLARLAQLREGRDEDIYRAQLARSNAEADRLATLFEANVLQLRTVRAQARQAAGAAQAARLSLAEKNLTAALAQQEAEITALLSLDPSTKGADLERLVLNGSPKEEADPGAIAQAFSDSLSLFEAERMRETLFNGALPQSLAGLPNDPVAQFKADTIMSAMSYKGVDPVAAFGIFQGQPVAGVFLQAPDPRSVATNMSKLISDSLRTELEKSDRLMELSTHLSRMMKTVYGDAWELEAQAKVVSALQRKIKDAAAAGNADALQMQELQARLSDAWKDFNALMGKTKADYVAFETEIEALGLDSSLKPHDDFGAVAPQARSEADPSAASDFAAQFYAYWTNRMEDRSFAKNQRAALVAILNGLPKDTTDKLAGAIQKIYGVDSKHSKDGLDHPGDIEAFLLAKASEEEIRNENLAPLERSRELITNDAAGKKNSLSLDLVDLMGALGPAASKNAPAAKFLEFLRQDMDRRRALNEVDRVAYDQMGQGLRDAFWQTVPASDRFKGAFVALERRQKDLVAARQALLEDYLANFTNDSTEFVLTDLKLDDYLKAQEAFDGEVVRTLHSQEVVHHTDLALSLDGLYNVRGVLERSRDTIKYGRGILALDALVMLEQSRLEAARWEGRSADQIEAAQRALKRLEELKARWESGPRGAADLGPVYAVTALGKDGQRTWKVDQWLTAKQVDGMIGGEIEKGKDGRLYMTTAGGRREVVGGLDLLAVLKGRSESAERRNRETERIHDLSAAYDFVAQSLDPEHPDSAAMAGYQLKDLIDPADPTKGEYADGRVLFFKAPNPNDEPGAPHRALPLLTALEMPPESYLMYIYEGHKRLAPGAFPTLESLTAAQEKGDFVKLILSPRGAKALKAFEEELEAESLAEGWLGVKLGGYAFAVDNQGSVVAAYGSKADFKKYGLLQAKDNKEKAAWTFYRTKDLSLKVVEEVLPGKNRPVGRIVSVSAKPLGKGAPFTVNLPWPDEGAVKGQEHVIEGRLYGVVPDENADIVIDQDGALEAYQSRGALKTAAKSMELKSVEFAGENTAAQNAKDRTISPAYRLDHYELNGRPVMLDRSLLQESADATDAALSKSKHYALRHPLGLILEVPKSIGNALFEVATGRDPRLENNVLGQSAAHADYGGASVRHGIIRNAAGLIDVFDWLPNPLQIYDDPSQIPHRVRESSPVLPWQSIAQKSLRTEDNRYNIELGAKELQRIRTYSQAVLDAQTIQELANFHGGYTLKTITKKRGREGLYNDISVTAQRGPETLQEFLRQNPDAGQALTSGRRTTVSILADSANPAMRESGDPFSAEIRKIEVQYEIKTGADQSAAEVQALKGYPERLAAIFKKAFADEPGLQAKVAQAEKDFRQRSDERQQLDADTQALWDRFHRLAWEQGAREAVDLQIKDLKLRQRRLNRELTWWEKRLAQLQGSGPFGPTGPARPQNPTPVASVLGRLLMLSAVLAAALYALYLALKRAI